MIDFIRKLLSNYLLLVLLFTSPQIALSFNLPEIDSCKDTLAINQASTSDAGTSNEGIILHIANKVSTLDKVFFKAYLLNDNFSETPPSRELRLELLKANGERVLTQVHKIEEGVVEGTVGIPKEVEEGKYRLRAYTLNMLKRSYDQFVEYPIYLVDPKAKTVIFDDDTVRIYVEGGSFISGQKNRVIVYYPRSNDGHQNPGGVVLDDKNKVISTIQRYSDQIGTALLQPKAGSSYSLQLDDGRSLPFPEVKQEGYLLQVNNLNVKIAVARIVRSSGRLQDSIWLSGRVGGKEFFRQPVEWIENEALVNIDKEQLPTGLLKLRLLDNNHQTHAVRPVFNQNEAFKVTYQNTGEPDNGNGLKITTMNNGRPTAATIALSVNKPHPWEIHVPELNASARQQEHTRKSNNTSYQAQSRAEHFMRDLHVQVEFGSPDDNTRAHELLTERLKHTSEGIELFAYVYDLNNNLLEDTPIQIYAKTDQGASIIEVESDSEGRIEITNLNFTGTAELTFRTEGTDTKSRLVKAIPAEKEEIFNPKTSMKIPDEEKNGTTIPRKADIPVDTTGLIELEEAIVTENRIENKIKGVKTIYGIEIPGKRVKYQNHSKPKTFAQLLSEIPGVFVRNVGGTDDRVSIPRVNGQVMWVIDGYMLPQGYDGKILGYPLNSLGPVQDFLNPQDIERIDLLLGPDAAIYGSRASSGVFVITTRFADDQEFINRKDARLMLRGYEPKVDFNSYFNNLSRKEKRISTLLHWDPKFETFNQGKGLLKLPFHGSSIIMPLCVKYSSKIDL